MRRLNGTDKGLINFFYNLISDGIRKIVHQLIKFHKYVDVRKA